ncbi:hypothetical protein [Sphingobium cupriresistens]|uniref:hypothetical protein n=1 Tax=Sphingobium cupriresistens TaxID=1132417 RepID=UPI003BAE02F0
MHKHFMFAALLLLSACGDVPTSQATGEQVHKPSPSDLLATINQAYSENAVQAQREWGGKRVLVGGGFFSAGKLPEGGIGVLVHPGSGISLGEFRFADIHADMIAKLKKGDSVTAECTVDPSFEGFSGAQLLDCSPK